MAVTRQPDEPPAIPQANSHQRSPQTCTAFMQGPVDVLPPRKDILESKLQTETGDGPTTGEPNVSGRPVPIRIRTRDELLNKLREIDNSAA